MNISVTVKVKLKPQVNQWQSVQNGSTAVLQNLMVHERHPGNK